MYREKILDIPIYDVCKVVMIDTDSEKALLKKYDLDFSEKGIYAACWRYFYTDKAGDKCKAIFFIFNSNHKLPITHGIVAHEAFHASNYVLKQIGAKPTFKNDEPQAYLIEWFVNTVTKFLGDKVS